MDDDARLVSPEEEALDENAVESSYTMLRVFIWAIPILGFIGTVTDQAVAG